jgi:CBS domain-containing protein
MKLMSQDSVILVEQLMVSGDLVPVVSSEDFVKRALEVMCEKKLGFCCVVSTEGILIGVFTDGDLRRLVLKHQKPFTAILADDISLYTSKNPVTIKPGSSAIESVSVMRENNIWDMPVVEESGKFLGVLHLHSLI